jgi:hypothetical protein
VIPPIILGSLSITFQSCKKNDGKKDPDIRTSLVGTWELRQTSGAMIPATTLYPQGNGNILKFTEADYVLLKNGQILKSGKYVVTEDTTVEKNVCLIMPKGEYAHRIVYDGDYAATKVFLDVTGKTKICFGCYAFDAGIGEI